MQIALEIANLSNKSLGELQKLWTTYFDEKPLSSNKEFYIARISYRMQELLYGGLSTSTKNLILKMNSKPQSACKKRLPPAGTRIVRVFKGKEYVIRIMIDGFEFDGMKYKNLSTIAQKITNKRTSGYRFFKLEGECDDTEEG